VKPGGTGNPSRVIPWRLAPFPPRRSFNFSFPSALPPPKEKAYFSNPVFFGSELNRGPVPVLEFFADEVAEPFSGDSFLGHGVSVTDGDCVLGKSVIVDRNSKRGTDFILATISLAYGSRVIGGGPESFLKFTINLIGILNQFRFFHQGKYRSFVWGEIGVKR